MSSSATSDDVLWADMPGRVLSPDNVASHYLAVDAGRPRALHMTYYDPGSSVYRYHSAANMDAGGTSAFARFGHANPHCDLRQYDGDTDALAVHHRFDTADVVHVHMDYSTLDRGLSRWPRGKLLVRHYHGSDPISPTGAPSIFENTFDRNVGALQIGARLYHKRFSPDLHWLPIPVPVDDYAALRLECWRPIEERANRCIRIAHSPTHPRIKGTIEITTIVELLQSRGLPVELVMIQGMPHGDALRRKASCDVTFDSFWLGMQGSGLEAAAMGQAVIAGDSQVRDEMIEHVGYCPYTFAQNVETLAPLIEQVALDAPFRVAEAARVGAYVREFHDYPTVGARYWRILRAALSERGL